MSDAPRPMIVAEVDEGLGFLCGSTAWLNLSVTAEVILLQADKFAEILWAGLQWTLLKELDDPPIENVRFYVYDPRPYLPCGYRS